MSKKCNKCNTVQPLLNFYKKKNYIGKVVHFPECKQCYKQRTIKYAQSNPKIIKKIRKKYNNLHKDEINKQAKEFYQNNKQYYRDYINNKWKNDLNYKLSRLSRGHLLDALKRHTSGGKVNKNHSALILLGCTIEEFIQYLEQQFKPEMNWNNHGKVWEIDHIKPCSSFDLTDFKQQEICFHYTNIQPLFKTTAIAELFGYTNEIGNKNKGNIYLTNKISN